MLLSRYFTAEFQLCSHFFLKNKNPTWSFLKFNHKNRPVFQLFQFRPVHHVWMHLSEAILYTNIPRMKLTRRDPGAVSVRVFSETCLSTSSEHRKAFSPSLNGYFFLSPTKRFYDVKCYTNPWLIWILLKKWASTLLCILRLAFIPLSFSYKTVLVPSEGSIISNLTGENKTVNSRHRLESSEKSSYLPSSGVVFSQFCANCST